MRLDRVSLARLDVALPNSELQCNTCVFGMRLRLLNKALLLCGGLHGLRGEEQISKSYFLKVLSLSDILSYFHHRIKSMPFLILFLETNVIVNKVNRTILFSDINEVWFE